MEGTEVEFIEYTGIFARYIRKMDKWMRETDPEELYIPQPERNWFSNVGYTEINQEVVVFEHPFYPSSVLCSQLMLYFSEGMMIIIIPHEFMVPVRVRVLIYGIVDHTIQDLTIGEFLRHAVPHIMPSQ